MSATPRYTESPGIPLPSFIPTLRLIQYVFQWAGLFIYSLPILAHPLRLPVLVLRASILEVPNNVLVEHTSVAGGGGDGHTLGLLRPGDTCSVTNRSAIVRRWSGRALRGDYEHLTLEIPSWLEPEPEADGLWLRDLRTKRHSRRVP